MELLHGRQAARRLFSFVTFVPFCSDCLNETEGNKGFKPTFRRSCRQFPGISAPVLVAVGVGR